MNETIHRIMKENNLIIIIPAIFVWIMIGLFVMYGLDEPARINVDHSNLLIEEQMRLEEEFLQEFYQGSYDQRSPYIKVNPYGISPLSALMMFETEEREAFEVIIKGTSIDGDLSFITDENTFHMIPLYGLYFGINSIELYSYDKDLQVRGNAVFITNFEINDITDFDQLSLPTKIETTYEYFGNDWMLLTPAYNNLPVAYDYNGDIRWYTNIPLAFAPVFLDNGHLLIGTNRLLSDPYYTTGLFEMDLLGKIYKEYTIPGGYHHDVHEMENGNLLVLSNDFDGTVEDIVVEIDRLSGEVIKSWDIGDYIPKLQGMAEMWTADDWFHNNSIDYDPTTDSIILSGRHQDIVISIGYTSNQLNYVIGDPENWDIEFVNQYFFTPISPVFEWQYAQHSAKVLPDGSIFLFDNGNNKSKFTESYITPYNSYSRGVIYDINTDTMEIAQTYQFGKQLGNDFYSPYISNIDYYGEGHYLIHSGGIAKEYGVNPINVPAPLYDGESELELSSITIEIENDIVKYRLELDNHFYRATRISPYNGNTSFALGRPVRLGELNETETSTDLVPNKITVFKNIPRKYEATFIKEVDRLVVEGVFDRNDVIYLILENDSNVKTYYIPTSRTAYTAMCSAIFEGESRFLTFYVNETNLSGTYRIYLNINGHKYDSYKEVTFQE